MDPLSSCIALGPVAVYLLLLGLIHASSRPFLTSGFRDGAALAVAVSGFAVVGPLRLFVPAAAVYRFGGFVWLMLLALYGLGAILVLLMMRPRLIVYNVTTEQLRPVLAAVVQQVGNGARWAGDSLLLPKLGIQLHLESFPVTRIVQLVSAGTRQDFAGWRRLEVELRRSLGSVSSPRSLRGPTMIAFSFAIILVVVISMITGQQSVAHELRELVRFS